jgi:signal transduction histidine kinase/putative methionine-R-sulfoxide reductase with GAF domain
VFENEGKRVNELEVLRKASLSLTASLELEEVFNAILRSTLTLLPSANNSHIFLCLEDFRETLKFGAALWADGRKGEPFAIPRSDGLTATVAKRGEMLVVPDMRKHSLFQNTPEDWKGAIVGIPLKIGQRVVGVMNISYLTPREFSDSELRLLGLLGDQAAIAIENARLYEQAARERRHLGLLFDISRELGFSFEPDEILSRAVSLTSTAFNVLLGQAFAYQPDTNILSLRALHGKTKLTVDEYNRLVKIKMGDGLAGWVAQSRQPLYVGDVLQEDRWLHVPALDENVRSAISAPILAEEKILGVITIMDDHTFAFSDDHLELLQTICHQVGLALSNAARYQEMKRRLAEITLIQNLAQTFTRRLELQELLDEVVSQLAQLLGYPMVEIYLVEGDLMHLRSFSGDIQPPPAIPVTRGVVGRVARSGISALIDNVSLDPDYCADNPATVCELAVPIFRGDIVIGVINIETNEIAKFDQQDLILLQVLAGQISIAYENAVLYDQMRQHADDLERDVTRRTAELAELFELSQRIGYIFSYEDLFQVLLNHLYNATGGNFVSGCLWQDNVDSPTLYTLHPLEPSDQEKLLSYLRQKVELEVAGELPIRFNQIVVQPLVKNINVSPVTPIENYRHVPIQVGQRKVGILVVGETITSLSEDGERLLRTFANQAAGAIERVEAIRAAEKKRLESLVEYLPNGVLLLDAEKRILVINPMAQEILTSLNNEGKDGKLTQLAQFTMDELVNLSNGSVPVEINTNGQISKAYEVLAQKVGDQNNQYIIAIRDVTQEREIQTRIQMQDRLATVGQLAAGIAHDFNNIMAAILVYADLLRDDVTLSTSSKDRLAIIQQQVQRASSLIRQILDFSRRSVMEQSALNLLPFIKELEKMLHRVLPETIHLELTYKPGDYVVNADPTRLQQVFMNLALNARDAMPEGGLLHFEIDQYCLEPEDIAPLHYLPPGKWIRILIRDTGAGIPGEYLPHIFEPFFTTKPAGVGTGLGLAQVYGIIKQHEGYIDVKSKAGEGTVFTIYLPALETPKSDKISMDKTAQLDGEGQTVMVVEDDRATLEALCTLLEAHNYQVLTARNGREALECYTRDQSTISMVVSDVVMPEMGGVELYHQLKQRWGAIRMLFVTGHPMSGESQKLLEKGNVHWLQKPFSVKEFSQAVQSLFRA